MGFREKMELKNFIGVYPRELSKENCKGLINIFEEYKSLPGYAEEGDANKREGIRKDEACFFDEYTLKNAYGSKNAAKYVSAINERLQNCFNKYVKDFDWLSSYTLASHVVKIHHVRPHEGYHVFHAEASDVRSSTRCLVWLCYLNEVDEGGETEFLYQGHKEKPEPGKFVLWPAQWTHLHRGNPIYKGDKYYATGWFDFVK